MPANRIIVYSHGFGVQKDDRGLFSDIAASLPDFEHVMFEYNEVDSEKNQMTVSSIDKQAERLLNEINKVRTEKPDAEINLICHSQGCTVAALLMPHNIAKTIFTAPPMSVNVEGMLKFFGDRPGALVEVGGKSTIPRRDGSTTIIPNDYWKSLEGVDPPKLYNDFAKIISLTILNAQQDEVLSNSDASALNTDIDVITLPGDHNFTGEDRTKLKETILQALSD